MIIMSRMVSENLFIPLLYHNFILHFGVVPHKRVICPTNGWLGGGHPMDSCGPVSSLRFKILYCIGNRNIEHLEELYHEYPVPSLPLTHYHKQHAADYGAFLH